MEPNNIVIDQHRIVFMCLAKCASTSIQKAIVTALGLDPTKDINRHPQLSWQTKEYIYQHCLNYDIVAFVRDPHSRLVSAYRDKVETAVHPAFKKLGFTVGMGFTRFAKLVCHTPDAVADQHFRSQYYDLTYNNIFLPTTMGRVECISDDWEILRQSQKRLVLPELPHERRADYVPYMDYYNSSGLFMIVGIRYRMDRSFFARWL